MIQRFIELGEGYGDVFELCELAKTNKHRILHAFILHGKKNDKKSVSLALALKPAGDVPFIPIYSCREGIPFQEPKTERQLMFERTMHELDVVPVTLEVKHSSEFGSIDHYHQALIAIMRLNHLLPPLS
ncbi:methylthioribose kinase [Chryseomicrobium imtechense]